MPNLSNFRDDWSGWKPIEKFDVILLVVINLSNFWALYKSPAIKDTMATVQWRVFDDFQLCEL
jgi:hypothetical protein